MFAKYSVGAQRAAPALARHLLCPKTTLYSAGINRCRDRLLCRMKVKGRGSGKGSGRLPAPADDKQECLSYRAGLAARGKSRAGGKNGDCHQFAPRHGPIL